MIASSRIEPKHCDQRNDEDSVEYEKSEDDFCIGRTKEKTSKMPTRGSPVMAMSKPNTTRVDGEKP
jgi:hypothetical protein